ncbi:MAG: hypothetical protein U0939_17590 [Pirellulales bacterium]
MAGKKHAGVLFVDLTSGQFREWSALRGSCYVTRPDRTAGDNVTDVTLDRQGRRMAVSTDGFKVHLVDLKTGQAEFISHAGRPMTVRFSPDGESLLIAGWRDKKKHDKPMPLVLYDVASKSVKRDFEVSFDLYTAAISEDGRWVAAGVGMPPDPRLQIWDLHDPGSKPRELPQPVRVFTLAFRPQTPNELATGDVNGSVRFWRLSAGTSDWTASEPPISHDKQVRVVSFSEDGRLLLVGGEDNSARVWDATDRTAVGQRLDEWRSPDCSLVNSAAATAPRALDSEEHQALRSVAR